jgi:chromosomal replication initiation ATPase DnaA
LAKAQLRFQMVRGAYDNWIANTQRVGVEHDPQGASAGQTLVVQVANQYATEWLELRLKRLILRTLQAWSAARWVCGSKLTGKIQRREQARKPFKQVKEGVSMSAVSQAKASAPDRRTTNLTDLRTETREILENAHFRGWHYIVHRAGQPMIAILDHDEYERLLAVAAISNSDAQPKGRSIG